MKSRMTRRELAAVLAAPAALPGMPTAGEPQSGQDDLAKAREDLRRDLERLAKFEVPQATEPAFVFKP